MENGNFAMTISGAPITSETKKIIDAFSDVSRELAAAMAGNRPMHSLHEGLSVIQEEVFELQTEVYKNPQKHVGRDILARKEAIQVAAMAIQLLVDVL